MAHLIIHRFHRFLDSESLDGTAEYLEGVAAAARVEVVRVAAEPGLGGERRDEVVPLRGEFVALVNNDVIVSDGWLQGLLALLTSAADIGMVVPSSNQGPAAFTVDPVPYEIDVEGRDMTGEGRGWRDQTLGAGFSPVAPRLSPLGPEPFAEIDKVNRFARQVREQNQGQWGEADAAGSGCAVLKREVLRKLALFPSRTRLGTFDTAALGERVRHTGYRVAGSREVYVHNFASRSIVPV